MTIFYNVVHYFIVFNMLKCNISYSNEINLKLALTQLLFVISGLISIVHNSILPVFSI